jgi:hypothetical protein
MYVPLPRRSVDRAQGDDEMTTSVDSLVEAIKELVHETDWDVTQRVVTTPEKDLTKMEKVVVTLERPVYGNRGQGQELANDELDLKSSAGVVNGGRRGSRSDDG